MDKELSAQLLDKAAMICVAKHCGQRDKMGCSYFQHPMRVAMRCVTDEQKMVALLHDVIEDCDVTADNLLAEGFPPEVVEAIKPFLCDESEGKLDILDLEAWTLHRYFFAYGRLRDHTATLDKALEACSMH